MICNNKGLGIWGSLVGGLVRRTKWKEHVNDIETTMLVRGLGVEVAVYMVGRRGRRVIQGYKGIRRRWRFI